MTLVNLEQIYQARERLRGVILHTPLLPHHGVFLKPESFQPIGSFKIRGAFNKTAALAEQNPAGIIAHSSGNHAQGVAFAAQKLGLPAVIVMPTNAPAVKVEATRSYGAEIIFYDVATEKRDVVSKRVEDERPGWALVHPFNDEYVIAGQGTIGLEIFEDFPDVEQVIVPIGGGGLASGVATALKCLKPSVKVIGVEPELAADARESLAQGRVVEWAATDTNRTIADGVRTVSIGALTFAHLQAYIDEIITVSEAEIREAVRRLALDAKLVIEPAGAIPYAVWFSQRDQLPVKRNTVLVLSGGNIDPKLLASIVGI